MILTEKLVVRYGTRGVLDGVTIRFEVGLVHGIIGPNGCGKSTLLKALARQLHADGGTVLIEGKGAKEWRAKPFARRLAMLAQAQEQIGDASVYEYVSYGRFPHKDFMQRLDEEDRRIVDQAIMLTGMASLSERNLQSLSGGERQRARIAMAVAQQPAMLLLDEPTTYLDICHQLEIMELVRHLNRKLGMTIIMVLHDINQASYYSDRLVVMKSGSLYASGTPEEVIGADMLKEVFQVQARIEKDDESGRPVIASMKPSLMRNW